MNKKFLFEYYVKNNTYATSDRIKTSYAKLMKFKGFYYTIDDSFNDFFTLQFKINGFSSVNAMGKLMFDNEDDGIIKVLENIKENFVTQELGFLHFVKSEADLTISYNNAFNSNNSFVRTFRFYKEAK